MSHEQNLAIEKLILDLTSRSLLRQRIVPMFNGPQAVAEASFEFAEEKDLTWEEYRLRVSARLLALRIPEEGR